MKKIFFLLVAACLLCCMSCKNSAYTECMKILDEYENNIDNAKDCEELSNAMITCTSKVGELAEKYGEYNVTEEEGDKIEERSEELMEKWSNKAIELGCSDEEMEEALSSFDNL